MASKEKTTEKIEREYIIPLRKKGMSVAIYKKSPKAIKTIKEFVAKHMKIKDRDFKKIKLDKYLNEAIWHRGIKNPIHKIKVKVIKEDGYVHVSAIDLPKNINFKKIREDKKSKEQKEIGEKVAKEIEGRKKKEQENQEKNSDLDKNEVDDKVGEKEKEKPVEEPEQKEMKEKAKEKAKENKSLPKKVNQKAKEKKSLDKIPQGK